MTHVPLGLDECNSEIRPNLEKYWIKHEIPERIIKRSTILCFNNKSAYLQSEEIFKKQYSALVIKVEHCIEYESPENCASEE